jgi:hypothetical protein
MGRLISTGRIGGGPVIIDELTAERAKQIGIMIGTISHPDIVDVHVALAAAERGHAVLASDDADIAGVNPGWSSSTSDPVQTRRLDVPPVRTSAKPKGWTGRVRPGLFRRRR